MERPRWGKTIAAATAIVVNKEQHDVAQLVQTAEIAKAIGPEAGAAAERDVREEVARLNENGKHDHEEVFVGTEGRIYTSGRKDVKPRLSVLKGDKWLQTGQ